MVFWIDNQRTWVEVVDADLYGIFAFLNRGYIGYFVSRSIVLKAYKTKDIYTAGTTWTISEYALDRALAEHRKNNRQFRDRIKISPDHMTPKDVEEIIWIATHGVVRLNLITMPINSNLNILFND